MYSHAIPDAHLENSEGARHFQSDFLGGGRRHAYVSRGYLGAHAPRVGAGLGCAGATRTQTRAR